MQIKEGGAHLAVDASRLFEQLHHFFVCILRGAVRQARHAIRIISLSITYAIHRIPLNMYVSDDSVCQWIQDTLV